jgi:hypothetical protein
MNQIDRFRKRKSNLKKINERHGLSLVVDQALVNDFISSTINFQFIQDLDKTLNRTYEFTLDIDVSDQEAKKMVETMGNEFNDQKFDELITACRNDVLSALIGPFGLGGLVGKWDKNGGNVDTITNVRDKVYATGKEEGRYQDRGAYDPTTYHNHKDYIETNRKHSKAQDNGSLQDAYTGNTLTAHDNRNLDHTISAKEIHDDPGRILAEADGPTEANSFTNLNSTAETINKSKKAKTAEDFLADLKKTDSQRKEEIEALSRKQDLTDKERSRLKKLKTLENIDPEKMRKIDRKAREKYNNRLNKKYYCSKKFRVNVAQTGATEGATMGMQQALGLVFCEFFKATFDEIADIYKNGFSNGLEDARFLYILKERLKRIAKRIAAKWKDAFKALGTGFISGFISNIVTVVINMFVRTGKRIVRVIREGLFSLLRAVKMLCFPPEGMTLAQAAHEASKLIAAGLAVAGGIALEQQIDNMLKATPIIEPFADLITTVLVGGLTGLATTFIVYAIDKIDVFKVNDKEEHHFVMNKLEADLNSMFQHGDVLLEELQFFA